MAESEIRESDASSARSGRIEWILGVVIALVLAMAAIPGVRSTEDSTQAEMTVLGIEGLLLLARDKAMQTGANYLVFFEGDPRGGPVVNTKGEPVMALLIRDLDGDWLPSRSEYVASVPYQLLTGMEWGSERATAPAEGDLADELRGPWSFTQPNGSSRARWLLFEPDGAPHSFASVDREAGAAGSGAGTVYLHSPHRDYAVVVSPWGDVEVQIWDDGSSAWRNFE
jgi:hypothetical protein